MCLQLAICWLVPSLSSETTGQDHMHDGAYGKDSSRAYASHVSYLQHDALQFVHSLLLQQ